MSRSLISSGNYGPRGKYGYGGPNTQYTSFVLATQEIFYAPMLYNICEFLEGKVSVSNDRIELNGAK